MGIVIAVEGPDKSGKTTLLEALRSQPGFDRWPLFRMESPPAVLREPEASEMERIAYAFAQGMLVFKKTLSFFIDRCYISSYVYSRVYGRTAPLDHLYSLAIELKPIIIYVRTPPAVLIERLQREGDRLIQDRSRLLSIAMAYEDWYSGNRFGDRIIAAAGEGVSPLDEGFRIASYIRETYL